MRHFLLFVSLACALVATSTVVTAATPAKGELAPPFRLQDQHGHWRGLSDFKGQWLVMYFYPKDFTDGCTAEVCSFRDAIGTLRRAGARVIGVSLDDTGSHAKFAAKYHVPFPLLADSGHTVAAEYGVLVLAGGTYYARRTTFLIDPQGRVAKVYKNVDPEKNAAQVLADTAALQAAP